MIRLAQYQGCFLGLALGDALGAAYEGGPLERLLWKMIGKTADGKRRYTDDTQMSIDLAESFLSEKAIEQDALARRFASSYHWSRGYGPATSRLLKRIGRGQDFRQARFSSFKTGSFGNGAAMRAPILALCFPFDRQQLLLNNLACAEITHAHPWAIEGAKLIAVSTQAALTGQSNHFIVELLMQQCESSVYQNKITQLDNLSIQSPTSLIRKILGNGISAQDSCITAIYFALKFRELDMDLMLQKIIQLGGDTDTIAAMACAIWGAFNGEQVIENSQTDSIERKDKILQLSQQLFQLTVDAH